MIHHPSSIINDHSEESMIIGVDTGGTFTDFVYKDGDRWGVYKVLSTPSNPASAPSDPAVIKVSPEQYSSGGGL